jgi:hypothetical protein
MFIKSIAVFVYGITDKRRAKESGRKEISSTEINIFSVINPYTANVDNRVS